MKYHLLLVVPFLVAISGHAAPVSIFGPQKFSASLKAKEFQVSIPGPGANKDGVLTITNGDGQDLAPTTCSGGLVQRVLCGVENLKKAILSELQRPEKPEVYWNGQLVASKASLPQTKGKLQIAIKVQAQNNLKVRLQGLPTSYLSVEIKSESSVSNQLPIARMTATPTTGIAPELISFSGLTSSDPDAGDTITDYAWDFGDGGFSSGSLVTHNYASAGTFTAKLTVTDSKGGKSSTSQTIVIQANQAPLASFTSSTDTALGVLKAHLDGSSSTDADGNIVSFHWNFGDGNGAEVPVFDHIYAAPGTYQVELVVIDNKGGQTSLIKSLLVKDAVPPVISNISPASGSTTASLQITISGQSNEPLISAMVDTTAMTLSADRKSFQGTYSASVEGLKTLFLRTIDNGGNLVTTQLTYTFTSPNSPPDAKLLASTVSGNIPFTVNFDASGSSDPDNNIRSYFWDFGDGTFETTSTPKISHLYTQGGNLLAIVTVIDDRGASGSASVSIFGNTAPIAKVSVSPLGGAAPALIHFDGSLSIDPDGQALTAYRWNFGDGSSIETSVPKVDHTYSTPGSYIATLTIVDSFGQTDVEQVNISVTTPTNPGDEGSEGEPSAGVILATGLNPKSFNPLTATLVLRLDGVRFSSSKSEFVLYKNLEHLDEGAFILSSDSKEISIPLELEEGKNNVSLLARDEEGKFIRWESSYWAGSNTISFDLVDETGSRISNSEIEVFLSESQTVGVSASATGGQVLISNVPKTKAVVATGLSSGRLGVLRVGPNVTYGSVIMMATSLPSAIDNNDFSLGTQGWESGGANLSVLSDSSGTHLFAAGAAGSTSIIRRTFAATDKFAYSVGFQFIPLSLSDSYTAILRTSSGSYQVSTASSDELQATKDAALPTTWNTLTVEASGAGDIIEFVLILNFSTNVAARHPLLRLVGPESAHAAQSGANISSISAGSLKIDRFELFEYRSAYPAAPVGCVEEAIEGEGVLSVGSIPFASFKSSNPICGKMIFTKTLNRKIEVIAGYLELRAEKSPDYSNLSSCYPAVSSTAMEPEAIMALNNATAGFSPGIKGASDIVKMFKVPNYSPSLVEEYINLRVRIQYFEKWTEAGQAKSALRCGTYTIPTKFQPLESMADTHAAYRFSQKREDDQSLTQTNLGGDAWIRPHFRDFLSYALVATPELKFNDISNMNGGVFFEHSSHRRGVAVDLEAKNYKGSLNVVDELDAQAVIGAMYFKNSPTNLKMQIDKVLVTHETNDLNSFYNSVRTVCVGDGRSARSRIIKYTGHIDHFHFETYKNPEDYVDFRTKTPVVPDFGFIADASGVTKFKVVSDSNQTDYAWEIRDADNKLVKIYDKKSAEFVVGTIKNPSFLLPVGAYKVKLVAFKRIAGGAEVCSEIEKRLQVYDKIKCEGTYGNSVINSDGSIGGFAQVGTSLLKDQFSRTPFVDKDAEVCGTSKLFGTVQVFNSSVRGAADLKGWVEIRNRSIVKDVKADYYSQGCCNHKLSIANQTEFDGDFVITSPTKTVNTYGPTSLINKGPTIKGHGTLSDSGIYSRWSINVDSLIMNNSFIGSPASIPADNGEIPIRNMSGTVSMMNSHFQLEQGNIGGTVQLDNSQISGRRITTSGSSVTFINSTSANTGLNGTVFVDAAFSGSIVVRDTSIRSTLQGTWNIDRNLNSAVCTSFHPFISDNVIHYYYESPTSGPLVTNSCRTLMEPKNLLRYSIVDQLK